MGSKLGKLGQLFAKVQELMFSICNNAMLDENN